MKRSANQHIRTLIKASGYAQWEVAEMLGFGECSFSRLLRKELPAEQKKELILKINQLGGRL